MTITWELNASASGRAGPRSPSLGPGWARGGAATISYLRREPLDRVLILREGHLRAVLTEYQVQLQRSPVAPGHRPARRRRQTRRWPPHRCRPRPRTDPPKTHPGWPDQRICARRLVSRRTAGHRRGSYFRAGQASLAGPGVPGLLHPTAAARFLNPNWRRPGTHGRPGDTSAARAANGPATPATRSGHANDHPVSQRAPGQFRKLDAVAVLTGPLLPAPRSPAMEEIVASGCVSSARACPSCSGVIAGGRPRRRPRAFAAARPSMMSSRMNSASAANTWKTSRPPGVVVSSASLSDLKPIPRLRRPATMAMRSCRATRKYQ